MAEAGPKTKTTTANGASVPLEDADLRAGIAAARQAEDLTKAPSKRRAAKPKSGAAAKTRKPRAKKPVAAAKAPAKPAKAKTPKAAPAVSADALPPMAAMPAPSAFAPWGPAKAGFTATIAPLSAAGREWMRMAQATPTTAVRNAGDLSLTLLDFAGANTAAAFSAMRALAGAGSVGEAIEIQRSYAEEVAATTQDQIAELKEKSAEMLAENRAEFAPKAWLTWDRT